MAERNWALVMKAREVAAFVGVTHRTFAQWVAEGLIPSVIVGKCSRRFVRADLERWLKESK